MKKSKYLKAIFAVVYSKSGKEIQYLILKRKLHWIGWEFPKGKIEFLECKRKTVKREVKEETGLTSIKIKKFKEKGKYRYKKLLPDRAGYIGQTYQLFAVEVNYSKKITLDKLEHSAYQWLNFKDAYKKLTWPNQRKCLKRVNEWLENETP